MCRCICFTIDVPFKGASCIALMSLFFYKYFSSHGSYMPKQIHLLHGTSDATCHWSHSERMAQEVC
jgi:hypothetical protein